MTTQSVDMEPKNYILNCQYKDTKRVYEYLAFGVLSELQQCSHAVISRVPHTTDRGIETALYRDELQLVQIVGISTEQKYNGTLKYVVDTIDPSYYLKMTQEYLDNVR